MATMKISDEIGMVMQIDDGPITTMVNHRVLGTGEKHGIVDGMARTMDLVINPQMLNIMIAGAIKWIENAKRTHKISPKINPDLPVEFSIIPTAIGIDYKIEMETLDQEITWIKEPETLTFHAAQAFEISVEAFIYYIDTLVDLLTAINIEKAS